MNSQSEAKKAIVLLSGGLDSATSLFITRKQGWQLFALSFDYGQRHQAELDAARKIASDAEVVEHLIMTINLRAIGGSALTSDLIDVPKDRNENAIGEHDIPISYVPARNTIFLSFALAWAEVLGAFDIIIGVNANDYSGYPDCRPEFITAFETMANLSTKAAVDGKGHLTIHTPLMQMSKAEIVTTGTQLGLDYSKTISCYDATSNGLACSRCDSCFLRKKGFKEAGIPDPTRYQ